MKNISKNKVLLFLLYLTFSPLLQAAISQSEYFPAGIEETLLANTGIALEGSMGNTMYNPAALAFNKSKDDLSFTGVYLNKSSATGFKGKSINQTNISPAFTGAKYLLSPQKTFAFFIYRPIQIIQNNSNVINSVTIESNSELDFAIFGLSYAQKFSKKISIGATLEYATLNRQIRLTRYSQIISSEQLSLQEFVTNQDAINLKFAVFYKLNDQINLGARLTTPANFFKSESKLKKYEMNNTSSVTISNFQSEYNSDNPFDLAIGFSYKNASYRFVTDLGYLFSSKYANTEIDLSTSNHHMEANFRYGVGLIFNAYKKIDALLGMRFINRRVDLNNSTTATTPSEFTYSAGIKIPEKNSHFYTGVYYKKIRQSPNIEYFGTIFISVFKI